MAAVTVPLDPFQVLLGFAGCFAAGLLYGLLWLFDETVPASFTQLRQELLALRTMLRIRRIEQRTMAAMAEEASRLWESGR